MTADDENDDGEAAEKFAPSAVASRRRCPVLAARPGKLHFLSCAADELFRGVSRA
jgi:hypothetical protein